MFKTCLANWAGSSREANSDSSPRVTSISVHCRCNNIWRSATRLWWSSAKHSRSSISKAQHRKASTNPPHDQVKGFAGLAGLVGFVGFVGIFSCGLVSLNWLGFAPPKHVCKLAKSVKQNKPNMYLTSMQICWPIGLLVCVVGVWSTGQSANWPTGRLVFASDMLLPGLDS